MKRLNPETNKPFKYGDKREDGYLFRKYRRNHPSQKNEFYYEVWLSPEAFDREIEKQKEYTQNNKEKVKEKKKEWYLKNYEKVRKKRKEHYENNKDQTLAVQKKHYQNNKDQYNARDAKRRAIKNSQLNKLLFKLFAPEIKALYAKAQQLTRDTGISHHVHHYIPLARGGTNSISNLYVIPDSWNLQIGSKDPNNLTSKEDIKLREQILNYKC